MITTCALDIAADHAAFAGHFPNNPILPGAVLLDEMLSAAAGARGIDITRFRIASAKFLGVVRPGDALRLQLEDHSAGTIRFAIRGANGTVVSGTLASVSQEAHA